ncbi:unnamed protein product [Cyclocybe aegerita]|uniref:Protein kinase domain-containing protein n=1 Tax=Cyclocybe aegerita TaxID=1973307 RepID=A0A8S0W0D8_CYCAE|nr:unnamed protein product [Cyclocybe aegerita]
MPVLMQFDRLPFRFLSEVCEALEQFFQGLVFMHEHRIAHRDACWRNLMMDISKVMPTGYHFSNWMTEDGRKKPLQWFPRKSVAPVKYYYIDFGLSYRFPSDATSFNLMGVVGQDKTVPEKFAKAPYDAFKLDIYQLGNVIAELLENYEDLTVFKGLSELMKNRDPMQRPSASDAYETLVDIITDLTEEQLNRRVWLKQSPADLRYRVEFLNENPVEYYC